MCENSNTILFRATNGFMATSCLWQRDLKVVGSMYLLCQSILNLLGVIGLDVMNRSSYINYWYYGVANCFAKSQIVE